ncbi:hypothetical protein [Pseudomonas amygdali]|uniref:Uncharacterized protein n=2 Tax=Pseudomonas amygdali pv. lachrymans TaxID=53707 RepID=A0ABR5KQD0_PSEAV|nr:hypothetical protein [Pseudomonas amygdali]AXH59521.1 hypothetical protein PLA107_030300 [Pseudomonas amygdali pv. lachrymans str. M301315]KPC16948.1 Uncharacterized protein AC499_0150 [Pseudomonas amygdali pv. lachrymans]KPC17907.1 Uncharacterized protein AC499_1109 [Pseudomonas amygdali pv. lachrymans]RMT06263.1 hypothetical protein ALP54_03446 [Pseudomonas amygdali pv. lachrymans]
MKGFMIMLVCLLAILFSAFHPQGKRLAEKTSEWVTHHISDDVCSQSGREAQQACADQQNQMAGKIDPRLDMSDQQRALSKALEN